jgi:lipid-A-disaccharide synthase-like uncharacterized protein
MNAHLYEGLLFSSHVVVTPWKIIGMVGAILFASRWFVQAYYSRRAGKPVTPRSFWIMSLVGSIITLMYFIFSTKQDMVGVIQNLFPFLISIYNLYLDAKCAKAPERSLQADAPRAVPARTIHVQTPAPALATPEPVAD